MTSLNYSENNKSQEHVYQQFILYLNKTLTKSETTSMVQLNDIIYDFINKFILKVKTKDIDITPFQKLLLFYLNSKKISPIMMNYIPSLR